jgi:hypothetical protein
MALFFVNSVRADGHEHESVGTSRADSIRFAKKVLANPKLVGYEADTRPRFPGGDKIVSVYVVCKDREKGEKRIIFEGNREDYRTLEKRVSHVNPIGSGGFLWGLVAAGVAAGIGAAIGAAVSPKCPPTEEKHAPLTRMMCGATYGAKMGAVLGAAAMTGIGLVGAGVIDNPKWKDAAISAAAVAGTGLGVLSIYSFTQLVSARTVSEAAIVKAA